MFPELHLMLILSLKHDGAQFAHELLLIDSF